MIFNLFDNYEYFIFIKGDINNSLKFLPNKPNEPELSKTVSNESLSKHILENKKIINYIKKYFWFRNREIRYFENFSTKDLGNNVYYLFGTYIPNNSKTYKNVSVIAFIYGFYAFIKGSLSNLDTWKKQTKIIDGIEINICKIKVK